MKALEERIKKDGIVLSESILKVGSFLNQQIDIDFMMQMADEVARLYDGVKVTKVFTIESSGIAFAACIAAKLHVPVIFCKKSISSNVGSEVYSARVHSYTHGNDNDIVVSKEYLNPDDFVLIADDFLASGCALQGLISIVRASGAKISGAVVAVEKGFEGGGDSLRAEGIRVDSLAIVESMSPDGSITFRKQQ